MDFEGVPGLIRLMQEGDCLAVDTLRYMTGNSSYCDNELATAGVFCEGMIYQLRWKDLEGMWLLEHYDELKYFPGMTKRVREYLLKNPISERWEETESLEDLDTWCPDLAKEIRGFASFQECQMRGNPRQLRWVLLGWRRAVMNHRT